MIKCPKCDQNITGINIELIGPGAFNNCSNSYVAVTSPCNHAISAVPVSWELKIDDNKKEILKMQGDIETINRNIQIIGNKIDDLLRK